MSTSYILTFFPTVSILYVRLPEILCNNSHLKSNPTKISQTTKGGKYETQGPIFQVCYLYAL